MHTELQQSNWCLSPYSLRRSPAAALSAVGHKAILTPLDFFCFHLCCFLALIISPRRCAMYLPKKINNVKDYDDPDYGDGPYGGYSGLLGELAVGEPSDRHHGYEDNSCEQVNWVQQRAEAMMAKTVWPTDKQKDIMNWLSTSKYVINLKSKKGFYITKGHMVKLKNGENKEIIDWLLENGFVPDKVFPLMKLSTHHQVVNIERS